MVALKVSTDNEMSVFPYDPPNYEALEAAVGGNVEHVRPLGLDEKYHMLVNDIGLILDLPVNMLGSLLYGTHVHGSPILGDIAFCKIGYYCCERDLVGMEEEEARCLGDEFIRMTNGLVRWSAE